MVAPHERGDDHPVGTRGLRPVDALLQRQQLVGLEWALLPLDGERLQLAELELLARVAMGLRADVDRAVGGDVLQAGGDVDGVAEHREFLPGLTPDMAGDHQTRVDADVELEGHPDAALLDEARELVAHLDRRVDRLLGRLLEGRGDPEEGHHAVADVLVDVAAVRGDHAGQGGEAPVDDVGDFLGVEPLRHARESREVGEHDRHMPTFAVPGRRWGFHRDAPSGWWLGAGGFARGW